MADFAAFRAYGTMIPHWSIARWVERRLDKARQPGRKRRLTIGRNPLQTRVGTEETAMNSPTTEPLVLSAREDAVLRLTLNRAGARNALSQALMGTLQDALDAAATQKQVRVIVIAANGPAFSSGHDLKEMTARRTDADKGKA